MVSVSTLRVALNWLSSDAQVRSSAPVPRGRVVELAPASSAGAQSNAIDLTEDLARRLEEDVDYQILRKAFDLEQKTVSTPGSRAASAPAATPNQASDHELLALDSAFSRPSSLPSGNGVSRSATFSAAVDVVIGGPGLLQPGASADRRTLGLSVEAAAVRTADPLALDLGGHGLTTTGVAAGVSFDVNGDGEQEQVSTASGDTWFLALDRNGNGRVDDGHELFGDQNGASQGFEELARYDDNADGVIDSSDGVFSSLRLVQLMADGEQRQQSLANADVVAIELGHQNVRKAIDLYDYVAQAGTFRFADGSSGEAADLQLGYRPKD